MNPVFDTTKENQQQYEMLHYHATHCRCCNQPLSYWKQITNRAVKVGRVIIGLVPYELTQIECITPGCRLEKITTSPKDYHEQTSKYL